MKLILLGSCVSRDIFGPNFENGWKNIHINMSFNRSSLISLNGEPFNIDVSANPHLNPYQRRSLSDDLNKGFYKYIGKLKYDNHYLLIDFVDERFDLFYFEGKYSSISNEFLASKLMDEIRGRVVARFSDEVSALWKENCLVFIDRIKQVIDSKHIILHRAFWMEKYVDGEGTFEFPNLSEIRRQNELLKSYYDFFQENCPGIRLLDLNDRGFLADKNHIWGLGAMHYQTAYYEQCMDYILSLQE